MLVKSSAAFGGTGAPVLLVLEALIRCALDKSVVVVEKGSEVLMLVEPETSWFIKPGN